MVKLLCACKGMKTIFKILFFFKVFFFLAFTKFVKIIYLNTIQHYFHRAKYIPKTIHTPPYIRNKCNLTGSGRVSLCYLFEFSFIGLPPDFSIFHTPAEKIICESGMMSQEFSSKGKSKQFKPSSTCYMYEQIIQRETGSYAKLFR